VNIATRIGGNLGPEYSYRRIRAYRWSNCPLYQPHPCIWITRYGSWHQSFQ